jgi:methyl-accepting chemotaxis protein
VERLNAGDSDVRAIVQGDDEITYLAESLNSYLDSLGKENKRPGDA